MIKIIGNRYLIIILMMIIAFCSCDKAKKKASDKVMNFVFDAGNMHTSTRYWYEYNGGEKVSERSVQSTIFYGDVVDSSVWITSYEYNEKGLLYEKRIFAYDELSHIYQNFYDSNDSLVCSYSISSEGDTTYWSELGYFPDGQQVIFSRFIHKKIPDIDWEEDLSKMAAIVIEMDTMYCRNEYLYEGDFCMMKKVYDNNNNLSSIVEYHYNDKDIVEEKHYSNSNSITILDHTVKYDYSKSMVYPDMYTINNTGQIISKFINEFYQSGELATETTTSDNDDYIIIRYYENDREVGSVAISKKDNYEIRESISYYDNGDVEEVKTYTKDLK